MKKTNFYNLSLDQLRADLESRGQKGFRSQQLFRWVYDRGLTDPEQMSNLSKDFRVQVPHWYSFDLPQRLTEKVSLDGTRKYLFDVGEGLSVESVLIPSPGRWTLCISSEVGCNLACQFCFTGKQKLKKRLSTAEILGQFLGVKSHLPETIKISNIVFMGMGEPLDNPEAVFNFVDIVHSPWGINFSKKKITISTSGLVPLMSRVTNSGVRLAVSLNGVTDEVRSQIMPVNKRWPIAELLEACRDYTTRAKDKVTFEYVLLKGVTDSLSDARKLHRLTRDIPCKINIIPFNEHPGSGFYRPSEKQIVDFQNELIRLGAHVLRRKTMGRDIYAACGQLTSAHKEHPQVMSI